MSLHLKKLTTSPPGGWRYTQPQSGLTMSSITFFDLLKKVGQHRTNMGYPTETTLVEEIEDDICNSLSHEEQLRWCKTGVRGSKSIHWSMVSRFLIDLIGWLKTGFEPVAQEEAERRAEICRTCPLNIGMHGCGSCRNKLDEVRKDLMKLTTTNDVNLKACGVCGCELKTAVHVPLDVLRQGQKDLTFPEWCWQKELHQ